MDRIESERILGEIDEVEQSASVMQTAPRGVLHLAAPVSFGKKIRRAHLMR